MPEPDIHPPAVPVLVPKHPPRPGVDLLTSPRVAHRHDQGTGVPGGAPDRRSVRNDLSICAL